MAAIGRGDLLRSRRSRATRRPGRSRWPANADPDAFRAFIDIVGVLELPEVALARPGLFDKVIELGAAWRDEPAFGPDRAELVALANALRQGS